MQTSGNDFFFDFFLDFFLFLLGCLLSSSAFSPRVSIQMSTGMTLILCGELANRPGLFLGTTFTGSIGKAG